MTFLESFDSRDGLKAQIMAVAITQLLINKGIITSAEYQALVKAIGDELGIELGFKVEAEDQ